MFCAEKKKGFNLFIFKLKRQQRVAHILEVGLCVDVKCLLDDNRETELNTIKKNTHTELDNELFDIVIHGLKYFIIYIFYNPLTTHKQRLPMFKHCSPMLILQPFFYLFCCSNIFFCSSFLLFYFLAVIAVALFVWFK